VGTHRLTAAAGKKAAEVGEFYLGARGKSRTLSMATTEGWDKPLYRELPPLFSAHSGTSSQKGDAMTTKPDLPIIPFASRDAWEAWLEEHHATSDGLRLEIAKKGSGIETVSYTEALEAALCYGWIDGQKSSFDENYWLQRFTPRRPRSKWSKGNRQTATVLIEKDRMKPAGLREVERAKADGRWDSAYNAQSTATVPEDFRRDLEKNEVAREFFATLDSRNRYAILYQIQDAKRPETWKRRIEKYVAMLSEQKKLYP
jgi:uncharacterized protein YdeI (YjbR/CyaY-like superfamily)